jgi:ParB/RepB/Spo0J family partition protein
MVDKDKPIKKEGEGKFSQKSSSKSSLFSSPKARATLRKTPISGKPVLIPAIASKTQVIPDSFIYQSIALADIEPNPFYNLSSRNKEVSPGRANLIEKFRQFFQEGQMTEFVALVRPHPQMSQKYQLVYGHLRLKAANLAGLTHIGAVIKELSDDDMLMRLIMENQDRADFSKVETAAQIRHLREKYGWSYKVLGGFFNLPLVTVYDLFYLSIAPNNFLQFIEEQPQYYHAISEMMRLDVSLAGQQIIWEFIQNSHPTPRQVREKIKELLSTTNLK